MAQTRSLRNIPAAYDRRNFRKWYKNTTGFIKHRPLGSFFIALGALFLVILIGHILSQPKPQAETKPQTKTVKLYSIGSAPKATFQAKIEKAGVVKIIAQTSGIVQKVNVTDGTKVSKGKELLSLSSNYQGGNAPAISAQIAGAQYQNVLDTFSQQQDAISKQKDIANQTFNNYSDQQAIASQSASNTNALISQNQTVLDTLNQQLTADKVANLSPTVVPEETTIDTLQGAQNQLRAAVASLQEQTDTGKPPGQLATTTRDLTIEQLNIQTKALELNKEVTGLQSELAQVSADTMLPASPVDGVVERVFVHPGQLVSPGTELAIVSANEGSAQTIAVVDVPQQIAQDISHLEPSIVYIGGKSYQIKPYYISTDATNGLLYSIFYTIPTDRTSLVTDGQYINVDIPVGSINSGATVPFVPIDAVYQTQDSNYLLIDVNGKAVTRQVTLGNVFGSFVEVTDGLHLGDQVITDRNVIAGDKVTTN
jgi:multidrug resistance efflux pump